MRILAAERGLSDIVSGQQQLISDPLLFPEMGRAVSRIRDAVAGGEVIGIFGDYDADGITATAQLVRYFRRHAAEPTVLLPNREHDGYGLKERSVDRLGAKGASLIITVDTGIGAHEAIRYASSKGIDVIVTDHHRALSGRPPAHSVIHPAIPQAFPNPHLSGSGIAFMLVRALERGAVWNGIKEDFALAAIGTIGDLVPLLGENRTLVIHGLKFLAELPQGPLQEFAQFVQSKGTPLSSRDVAFRIVPRINASGRMDEPAIALDALLSGGESLKKLHQLNADRQALTTLLSERAESLIARDDLFLCLAHEEFTNGIIGLIAGKLTEKYGRPSLVASIRDGVCTGSLRSISGFDLAVALAHPDVQRHLINFGGHALAAGCTFLLSEFPALKRALHERFEEAGFTRADLAPRLAIDAELEATVLSFEFACALKRLEPHGVMNEPPIFLLKKQKIDAVRRVGSEAAHLQCRIGGVKAIGFGLGSLADQLSRDPVDLAFTVGVNEWSGSSECQMVLKDIRSATSFER